MKTKFLLKLTAFFIVLLTINFSQAQNTITISGQITDFNKNPIDSCIVKIYHRDFSTAYETYTDKNGFYKLENVLKGEYMAMYAIRPREYPRENKVSEDKMRLEFWAWNIIADKNLTINPKYDKLELYGTNVFQVYGGKPGLFIYFRPMSLKKYISYSKDIYLNKSKAESIADISVKPENLNIEVFADDELLKINSIQTIQEYEGDGKMPMIGYILQVDPPKQKPKNSYVVIRVVAENKEFREKGENLYFYEFDKFN